MGEAPHARDENLTALVLEQLLGIRAAKGRLTPQKLGQFRVLVQIMGADDLLDAFFAFRRELRRYIDTANRDEAAAALSIYADHENLLDRLQEAANRYSDDQLRDQRTARRWSDKGMPRVAEDLVYMAEVQGRLGRELLQIEVHGHEDGGLLIVVEQMVQSDLDVRAPEITLWAMNDNGDPEECTVDLAHYAAREATKGEFRLIHQRVVLVRQLLDRITPARGLTIAVTGRDAPMRTISFTGDWRPPEGLQVAMSAYRTRAAVEVTRRE